MRCCPAAGGSHFRGTTAAAAAVPDQGPGDVVIYTRTAGPGHRFGRAGCAISTATTATTTPACVYGVAGLRRTAIPTTCASAAGLGLSSGTSTACPPACWRGQLIGELAAAATAALGCDPECAGWRTITSNV
jgi:hypothetical protein